jgi:hypothetical protein
MMTASEYYQLNRFPVTNSLPFDQFVSALKIKVNQIFVCYDMGENIRYLKITNALDNICFDTLECTPNGDYVRYPYKKGGVKRYEIAERLYDGDWKIVENTETLLLPKRKSSKNTAPNNGNLQP